MSAAFPNTVSELQSSIHHKWERYEQFTLRRFDTPRRNEFYGATDALWDTDHALRSVWNGLPKQEGLAKLVAYGMLQALVSQQEAAKSLREIILPRLAWKVSDVTELQRIRILRVRLSGHIVLARHYGGTASTINVRDPDFISGVIYGLDSESADRFPKASIQGLILENSAGLLPLLTEVDRALNEPEMVFRTLSQT
ncbi:MAG: hypothetical protein EON58_16115 [Alphaproteobacteria bacterium]|nr:MAG: hypothetical protein EON58_16115 [Alphaproteobacteria bacterium]